MKTNKKQEALYGLVGLVIVSTIFVLAMNKSPKEAQTVPKDEQNTKFLATYSIQSDFLKRAGYTKDVTQRKNGACGYALTFYASENNFEIKNDIIADDGIIATLKKEKQEIEVACSTSNMKIDATTGFNPVLNEIIQ